MGVVNVTPDSFSDSGRRLLRDTAVAHARTLVESGADVVDVGGESTRPGAEAVTVDAELRRVVPVIERLSVLRVPVSVDTSKFEVAKAALDAGAAWVNDVTAFRGDPRMAELVAERGATCCLMHMRGNPRTMQVDPQYDDVVSDVKAFLEEQLKFALTAGIAEERVVLDPGLGFGKTVAQNLELLARLDELAALGRPVLIGASRKSFLGAVTGRPVTRREDATAAANVLAFERGATIFRVHEVTPTRDALAIATALRCQTGHGDAVGRGRFLHTFAGPGQRPLTG